MLNIRIQKGISLVEIALALAALGVLGLAGVSVLQKSQNRDIASELAQEELLRRADNVMTAFIVNNARVPCGAASEGIEICDGKTSGYLPWATLGVFPAGQTSPDIKSATSNTKFNINYSVQDGSLMKAPPASKVIKLNETTLLKMPDTTIKELYPGISYEDRNRVADFCINLAGGTSGGLANPLGEAYRFEIKGSSSNRIISRNREEVWGRVGCPSLVASERTLFPTLSAAQSILEKSVSDIEILSQRRDELTDFTMANVAALNGFFLIVGSMLPIAIAEKFIVAATHKAMAIGGLRLDAIAKAKIATKQGVVYTAILFKSVIPRLAFLFVAVTSAGIVKAMTARRVGYYSNYKKDLKIRFKKSKGVQMQAISSGVYID